MKKTSMFWRNFATKAAATAAIQQIINTQAFKVPFESELISDLVYERHYFCSIRGLRPARFRKIPGYKAYSFEGDFSGCQLERTIGWHPVSWTKCLNPPQTDWDRIVRAMRDRCEPIKSKYRNAHPICEACGVLSSTEVHHSSPTFLALTELIRSQIEDLEITDCLANWDWFEKDDFALPEGHRITELFDFYHDLSTLQALCKGCHDKTKKKAK